MDQYVYSNTLKSIEAKRKKDEEQKQRDEAAEQKTETQEKRTSTRKRDRGGNFFVDQCDDLFRNITSLAL